MGLPVYFGPSMRMLDTMFGERIRYWRCQRCPCYDPQSGQWNRTHTLCGGTGQIRVELDVTRYSAIITGAETSRQFANIGPLEQGTLVCSAWPDEIPLSPDDQVVVPTRTATYTEILTRGSGSQDEFARDNVTDIVSVFDQTAQVTSGYSLGTDAILWSGGPAVGSRYSVRFNYNPTYQVIEDARLNRAPDPNGQPIPRRVLLKLLPAPQP